MKGFKDCGIKWEQVTSSHETITLFSMLQGNNIVLKTWPFDRLVVTLDRIVMEGNECKGKEEVLVPIKDIVAITSRALEGVLVVEYIHKNYQQRLTITVKEEDRRDFDRLVESLGKKWSGGEIKFVQVKQQQSSLRTAVPEPQEFAKRRWRYHQPAFVATKTYGKPKLSKYREQYVETPSPGKRKDPRKSGLASKDGLIHKKRKIAPLSLTVSPAHSPKRSSALSSSHSPGGLLNTGNTCYLNALLQVLVRLSVFVKGMEEMWNRKLALSSDESKLQKPASAAVSAFLDCVRHARKATKMLSSSTGEMKTKRLVHDASAVKNAVANCAEEMKTDNVKRFATNDQQDVQEFLNYLLDTFEIALGQEFVASIFGSITTQTLSCRNCPYSFSSKVPCWDFSLGFEEAEPAYDGKYELLALVTSSFRDEDVAYKCGECDGNMAHLKDQPAQLAPVLVFHIKRFDNDGRKRKDPVVAEPQMKLFGSCYNLHGIVFHYGSTLHFGHYESAVSTKKDPTKWSWFNDSHVDRDISQLDILNSERNRTNSYMYVYVKQTENSPQESFQAITIA